MALKCANLAQLNCILQILLCTYFLLAWAIREIPMGYFEDRGETAALLWFTHIVTYLLAYCDDDEFLQVLECLSSTVLCE